MKLYGMPSLALTLLFFTLSTLAAAEATPTNPGAKTPGKFIDLVFKQSGEQSLMLDLYLPKPGSARAPCLVWIHGGGWGSGTKTGSPLLSLLPSGFAVASVTYRFKDKAPFPAQIEDVKAAIRWLRAHADDYNLDVDRFGVAGYSAGGHLAALVAVTGKDSSFDVGDNLKLSSAVKAVCVISGPTDIVAFFEGANETRRKLLEGLLGGPLADKQKLAESASPLYYIKPGLPPFMVIHGDVDKTVPIQQAQAMISKLEKCGTPPKVIIMPQVGHDIMGSQKNFIEDIRTFFMTNLVNKP